MFLLYRICHLYLAKNNKIRTDALKRPTKLNKLISIRNNQNKNMLKEKH